MTTIIKLTQDKFTLIDDEDYALVGEYKWYAHADSNVWYAVRNGPKNKRIIMHRIIMNAKEDEEVDHKDHDGLNNQRYNLRFCTKAQNTANMRKRNNTTSIYKGVYWQSKRKKWRACITANYYNLDLGGFDTEAEAAITYNNAAVEIFGEYANINIIIERG